MPRAKKGMEVEGEPEVSRWSEVATAERWDRKTRRVPGGLYVHAHVCTRTQAHARPCTHWPGPKASPHSVNALSHPGLPPPFFWPAWCLSPHFPIPGIIPTRGGLRSPLKAGRMVRGKSAASTPHFITILSSPSHLQK